MFSRSHALETQLDRCIDALLAGEDWHSVADESAEYELFSLMPIAEWLHHTARQLPRDVRAVRKRVWLRLEARLFPPAATPGAFSRALGFAGAG